MRYKPEHGHSRLRLIHVGYRVLEELDRTLFSWNIQDNISCLAHYQSRRTHLRDLLKSSAKVHETFCP